MLSMKYCNKFYVEGPRSKTCSPVFREHEGTRSIEKYKNVQMSSEKYSEIRKRTSNETNELLGSRTLFRK